MGEEGVGGQRVNDIMKGQRTSGARSVVRQRGKLSAHDDCYAVNQPHSTVGEDKLAARSSLFD